MKPKLGMKTGQLISVVLALGVMMSACGGEKGASGEEGRLQIAVIPKGTTHQYWKSIHAGAIKGAQEADVDIIWQGPQKEDDRQMQIQVVQNFISRDIDAIVLAPLDSRAMVPPVEAAIKREIPVVIMDSGLESDQFASFVATDNVEGGRLCARRLADVMEKEGQVIVLRYLEGSASTTRREQGFLEELAAYAPNIEILVENQYAGATMEKAIQASQNLLNRFEEVDGVFASNETATQGMLRALQTAGKAGSVHLVGFDSNETLIGALESGDIAGLAVQDPFNMGYLSVLTANAILTGNPVEARIDTGVSMITADNMTTERNAQLLRPDVERWLNE